MGSNLDEQSIGLIDRLEEKPSAARMDETHPYYWYIQLRRMGKIAQTANLVERAINEFTEKNPFCPILKVVSRKHLTYALCSTAVRNNGLNLRYVPEKYMDYQMALLAVSENGEALLDVPPALLSGAEGYELCLKAVQNDVSGFILSRVPKCYLTGDKGKALCKAAVVFNGYAIKYVPKRMLSKTLVSCALEKPAPVREYRDFCGTPIHQGPDGNQFTSPLSFIPKRFLSREIVEMAVRSYPISLQDAPSEFISKELCMWALDQDPMNLEYIPNPSNPLIEYAIEKDPQVIMKVPAPLLSIGLCRRALQRNPELPIHTLPSQIQEQLKAEGLIASPDSIISITPIKSAIPFCKDKTPFRIPKTISKDSHFIYDLTEGDGPARTLHYITDLHLEFQIEKAGKNGDSEHDVAYEAHNYTEDDIRKRIKRKLKTLVSSADNQYDMLLIGGDVANSIELESIFYEELTSHDGWKGEIVCILGNHELIADGTKTCASRKCTAGESIDEIVSAYRKAIGPRATLLENQLYMLYKGRKRVVLDEADIINSSVDELTEACNMSSMLILGGIGFSGLNPIYNANSILYNSSMTLEEDVARAKRFRAVYEKVLTCAGNLRVIVLTHTQMANWSTDAYNPKWIYVNGHTHQNTLLLDKSGVILSDNQIGYAPKPWKLKGFNLDIRRVDIFASYPDGAHQIGHDQYIEFNRCMGISVQSCKYLGEIYALKRCGYYMFILKDGERLYLLVGGRRNKLTHGIDYYLEHLPVYVDRVQGAFGPYQNALHMIADEVKQFGGSGTEHGCIVDIDYFNHIYLNPFDGKLTPYFAWDMDNKITFKTVGQLLNGSPFLFQESSMLERYKKLSKCRALPMLSGHDNDNEGIATIPSLVLDRAIYKPSRIMRSIQYLFDQNIIRVWRDEILSFDPSIANTQPIYAIEQAEQECNETSGNY